ncbi:unnamed protein product [Clavelina lepadiformis]|uniref:Uncharacterized protein n=1 Tax=Clavelina lepadiformis TaxID=159417 RepID=A0ABP0GUJ3_CLALP
MKIGRIFRPESTIKPLTIECIDEYASHIQQPTGGNTVGPVTEISCLHRNTTLRRQYEDCFTLSLQEEKDRQQFEVESVVAFVEDHWACDRWVNNLVTLNSIFFTTKQMFAVNKLTSL